MRLFVRQGAIGTSAADRCLLSEEPGGVLVHRGRGRARKTIEQRVSAQGHGPIFAQLVPEHEGLAELFGTQKVTAGLANKAIRGQRKRVSTDSGSPLKSNRIMAMPFPVPR